MQFLAKGVLPTISTFLANASSSATSLYIPFPWFQLVMPSLSSMKEIHRTRKSKKVKIWLRESDECLLLVTFSSQV